MKWRKIQRSGIDGLVVPFRMDEEKGATKGSTYPDLPTFTPMPSPQRGTLAFPESQDSAAGDAAASAAAVPTKETGWGAMFRERFASGKKQEVLEFCIRIPAEQSGVSVRFLRLSKGSDTNFKIIN